MTKKQTLDELSIDDIQKQFNELLKESGVDLNESYTKDLENILGFDMDDLTEEIEMLYRTKTIKVKRTHQDAVLPKYAYPTDSGFDLHSVEKVLVEPFGRSLVSTGLKFEFDENFEIQIRPKSGLCLKMGLTVLNTPGTIDQGYTDEVKVIVFNTNPNSIIIEKGMKIAQAVLCPVINGKFVKVEEVDEISDKDRGDNGFGSTGIL